MRSSRVSLRHPPPLALGNIADDRFAAFIHGDVFHGYLLWLPFPLREFVARSAAYQFS
jgi:hypothetical protein